MKLNQEKAEILKNEKALIILNILFIFYYS